MTPAPPLFAHVAALTDGVGMFEHALLARPRTAGGYCVDDVARALVATCRAEDLDAARPLSRTAMNRLREVYLSFLENAQTPDGRVVNRRETSGRLSGTAGADDAWGRSLWAFGTAAGRSRDSSVVQRAGVRFTLGASRRSPWARSMAFAGLGAFEVLRADPGHQVASELLRDATALVGPFLRYQSWPWPEPRLTYANAVLADVLLAAGDALDDPKLVHQGLTVLEWLVELQTTGEHLSLVPAAGWVTGEPWPGFDQQPIEAATLADACARAFELTGDPRWSQTVAMAAAWFFGDNDAGAALYDEASGGCCDGLEPLGRNENQGAESALAFVTTVQHAHRLVGV